MPLINKIIQVNNTKNICVVARVRPKKERSDLWSPRVSHQTCASAFVINFFILI